MQIRIGFSKRDMFFSKFLRWAEKRPYSHCYLRYQNHVTGQDLILHAAVLSIHTLTLENFKKHGNVIVKEYMYEVTDQAKIKDLLTFVYNQSGTPYGWVQLVGMGLVKLAAFFGKKIKNPLADKKKTMVCSEFCAYAVKISGISPNIDLELTEVGGPSWLDKYLSKSVK